MAFTPLYAGPRGFGSSSSEVKMPSGQSKGARELFDSSWIHAKNLIQRRKERKPQGQRYM